MLAFAATCAAVFASINAFGAWVTQNRRRWIAWLFLLASWLLVIAFVMLVYGLPAALWPLGAGLLLTMLSSWLHAVLVAAHVVPRNHLLRAAAAVAVFLAGCAGLR
ncbi:MAG TPA: hypothetical protein VK092_01965 [Deinococcales bacterium]|nr:hypothetical protein [Deinococcales bacterium]